MARIEIIHSDEVDPQRCYAAGHVANGVVSSRLLQPAGYSLWACLTELEDGGEIEWRGDAAEEALYVSSGMLEIVGRDCATGGAIVLESGVTATARAHGPTQVIHFGPADPLGARWW